MLRLVRGHQIREVRNSSKAQPVVVGSLLTKVELVSNLRNRGGLRETKNKSPGAENGLRKWTRNLDPERRWAFGFVARPVTRNRELSPHRCWRYRTPPCAGPAGGFIPV